MTPWQLVRRSLRFFGRSHAAVVVGSGLATAILTGALVVGDSVRGTLRRQTLDRLGRTEHALVAGERLVRASLADELGARLGTDAAPVLLVDGVAAADDRTVHRVQVVGVDARFWRLGPGGDPLGGVEPGSAAVNGRLAGQLGLAPGDAFTVRVKRRDSLPGDLPLAPRQRAPVGLGLELRAVLGDGELGRFGLAVHQVAPASVFVPRRTLERRLGLEDRANVVLVAERPGRPLALAEVEAAVAGSWRLEDAGLALEPVGRELRLVSSRVLMEPAVERAAVAATPRSDGVLAMLVNRVAAGDQWSPYVFVAALDRPPGVGLADDQIVLTDWLARDLGVGPGARVELEYFLPEAGARLETRRSSFEVREVIPVSEADPSLAPRLPGVTDADDCDDWDPSIPVDLDLVRERDRAFWRDHRATPRAFVSLAAGRAMWGSRFGALTAIRYPGELDRGSLARSILSGLRPSAVGLALEPLRAEGLRAAREGVDFGQLFLGLSMFLLAAALLLVGLLFSLQIGRRGAEVGALLALGLSPGRVRGLLLLEGAMLAVAGAAVGAPAAVAYAGVVLVALGGVWRGAVGAASLHLAVVPTTLILGAAAAAVLAAVSMAVALRRLSRRPLLALLGRCPPDLGRSASSRRPVGAIAAVPAAAAALLVVARTPSGQGSGSVAAFWIAGTLVLLAGLGLLQALLVVLGRAPLAVGAASAGLRGAGRRRGRSLTAAAMLACGVFVVVATAANRRGLPSDPLDRASGTGGFLLWGETSLPIDRNLSDPVHRRGLGLEELDARVVQLRRWPGDDASCLNLNRVRTPPILGVDPEELAGRRAFRAARMAAGLDPSDPWRALTRPLPDGAVPALADLAVIVWGLGLEVGDDLVVADERGEELRLRLVGGLESSVLQGHVVVDERVFTTRFPSSSGSHVLLVDAPPEWQGEVMERLRGGLGDLGLELEPGRDRLAAFATVENTYLVVFLALGGLGLVVGTLGFAVVVLRQALEQRGELAVLRAMGLGRRLVARILLAEHLVALLGGAACGGLAALVAVVPALRSETAEIPVPAVAATLLAIVATGVAATMVAARAATAADPVPALRGE